MTRFARVTAKALIVTGALMLYSTTGAHGQPRPVTVEELTQESEVVAVGKVTGMRGEWDQNKTRIVTRVTVEVSEYLKGNAGTVITITAPGGEVDGVGEWYSHTARFKKEDRVVVFAEKDKKGNLRVARGEQGKLDIKKDNRTSTERVSTQMTLDEFKAQVKRAASASQGR